MSKPRLIILSDIYGNLQPDWMVSYTHFLTPHFDIQYYDSRVLAEINLNEKNVEEIHRQFINGGLEKAVENLLKLENEEGIVLGFSIGGTIAWKAILKGLKTTYLFAVSSTRLRLETKQPKIPISLFYGENDLNQPEMEWYVGKNLQPEIISGKSHDFYREKEWTEHISKQVIKLSNNHPIH